MSTTTTGSVKTGHGDDAAEGFSRTEEGRPAAEAADAARHSARSNKSSSAFRTISEVADDLGVQQHVLRFWESKFSQVRPLKRGGGRRYYRPEDIRLLRSIHHLLYTEGYTIKGVQKLLRDVGKKKLIEDMDLQGVAPEAVSHEVPQAQIDTRRSGSINIAPPSGLSADQRKTLNAVLHELKELRAIVRGGE